MIGAGYSGTFCLPVASSSGSRARGTQIGGSTAK